MASLSEDDLNLRDLSDEELALAWDLWFDLAQATNEADPPYTHGVFQLVGHAVSGSELGEPASEKSVGVGCHVVKRPAAPRVFLVVDRDAGYLPELLAVAPVWVVNTPRNAERVTRLWDSGARESGRLTLFDVASQEPMEEELGMLDDIRDHSWDYGVPDVTRVEVVGVRCDRAWSDMLTSLRWRYVGATSLGFLVEPLDSKPEQAARMASLS